MSTQPTIPDARSYNRKLLDQVRAMLTGKALDDVAMYKIGGRELTKIPLPELRAWEADLEARVVREMRRKAGKPTRSSYIIFGSAATRRPRFAGLRLLIGRLLIALLADPSDGKPNDSLHSGTAPIVTTPEPIRIPSLDKVSAYRPSTAYVVLFLLTLERFIPPAEGAHHSLTADAEGGLRLQALVQGRLVNAVIEEFGNDPIEDARVAADEMVSEVLRALEGN